MILLQQIEAEAFLKYFFPWCWKITSERADKTRSNLFWLDLILIPFYFSYSFKSWTRSCIIGLVYRYTRSRKNKKNSQNNNHITLFGSQSLPCLATGQWAKNHMKIDKVFGPIVFLFEVLFLATLLVWLSVCKAMKTVHLFPPFFHSALLIATFHFLERKFPTLLNDVPHFIFMNLKPCTVFYKSFHTLATVWNKTSIDYKED